MSLYEEFWGVDLPKGGEVTAARAGSHTEMFSSSLRCHNSQWAHPPAPAGSRGSQHHG